MSEFGVWLPGSGDTPREDFKNGLERTASISVHFGGMDALNVIADIESYRTQTVAQIGDAPDVSAERAASWLEHEDRAQLPLPMADCEFFALLDEDVAGALRSPLAPDEVVGIYNEWAEQTKREFEAAHGLEEGWCDVEVGP